MLQREIDIAKKEKATAVKEKAKAIELKEAALDVIKCPICLKVTEERYVTTCCRQTICRVCYKNEKVVKCPWCKTQIKKTKLSRAAKVGNSSLLGLGDEHMNIGTKTKTNRFIAKVYPTTPQCLLDKE